MKNSNVDQILSRVLNDAKKFIGYPPNVYLNFFQGKRVYKKVNCPGRKCPGQRARSPMLAVEADLLP